MTTSSVPLTETQHKSSTTPLVAREGFSPTSTSSNSSVSRSMTAAYPSMVPAAQSVVPAGLMAGARWAESSTSFSRLRGPIDRSAVRTIWKYRSPSSVS